jgi:hypothetical protein
LCQVEPASHASGQTARALTGHAAETEPLDELVAAPGGLALGQAVEPAAQDQVLRDCQVQIDAGVLTRVADQLADAPTVASYVVASDTGCAGCGLQQRDEDPDGCGLAGAVGPRNPKISPASVAKLMPASARVPSP